MRLNRAVLVGILMPLALTLGASPTSAAFSNIVQLVLQQGVIPTTNGVNVVGAPAYTGAVDTYVWETTPATAYGDAPQLRFGGYQWPGNTNQAFAYITFDIASCLPLPADAKVVDASLYLIGAGMWATLAGETRFGYSTATWNTNLTWSGSKPGVQDNGYILLSAWGGWPSNTLGYMRIASIVQGWHSGALNNYGMQLYCSRGNTTYDGYWIWSSEAPQVTNRPKLVIDYVMTGNDVPAPRGWGGTVARNRVIVTNGPSVFDDTYVSAAPNDASNYATATTADLRTYNNPATPRRALLKVKLDDPGMPQFAKSTDPFLADVPRLMNARLQFSTTYQIDGFSLWAATQTWNVASVTLLTRDGVNPWAEVWSGDAAPMRNVGTSYGAASFNYYTRGGCWSWDVTPTIQGQIDGTISNCGFVMGHISGAAYQNNLCMTEFSVPHMRPTLLLQVWYPLQSGTVILLK